MNDEDYFIQLMEEIRPLISIGYEIFIRMCSPLSPDLERRKYQIEISSMTYYDSAESADLNEAARQILQTRKAWKEALRLEQEKQESNDPQFS